MECLWDSPCRPCGGNGVSLRWNKDKLWATTAATAAAAVATAAEKATAV
jgi:hypothetical protein